MTKQLEKEFADVYCESDWCTVIIIHSSTRERQQGSSHHLPDDSLLFSIASFEHCSLEDEDQSLTGPGRLQEGWLTAAQALAKESGEVVTLKLHRGYTNDIRVDHLIVHQDSVEVLRVTELGFFAASASSSEQIVRNMHRFKYGVFNPRTEK